MAVLPKIVYNFNENDTTTIRDYSENGYDGTGSNITIQDSTRVGKEAVFNSVNDNVNAGNITVLNGVTDMSLHLGISIDSTTANGYIVLKDSQLSVYYNNATDEIEVSLFVASGTAFVSAAVSDDTYYDIDVVYVSNFLFIYVDGVLIDSDNSENGVIATNTNDLVIGDSSSSAFFQLNEFKLYSDPITTTIISAVINNSNGVVSNTGVFTEFEVGDVLYTDIDGTPKYSIVTYKDNAVDSSFRFLPLTDGILSSSKFSRGGHLWDTDRQYCFKIDKTPQICFYDGVSKSSEVFAESKKTYCINKGGAIKSSISKTANYTALNSDQRIYIDSSGGTFTITLPSTPSTDKELQIIDSVGSCNSFNVTIDGNGNNINGSATGIISGDYESWNLVYNGTEWNLI